MRKKNTDHTFSFRQYAMKQFRHNKPAYVSVYILLFFTILAIFAPVLANEKPLYMQYKGEHYFPAFSFKNSYFIELADGNQEKIQLDIADWKQMEFDRVIWAPVPYSPGKSDRLNSGYKSPGGEQFFKDKNGAVMPMPTRFRHILGTGSRGDDLMAGLIHGSRISLTIGFISMAIATIIGLLLGSMAGYFGDNKLYTSRGRFWMVITGILAGWFYGFQARQFILQEAIQTSGFTLVLQLVFSLVIFAGVIYIFSQLGRLIGKLPWLKNPVNIPVDGLVSRTIEIFHSLPTFILILTIAAIARPSLTNIMIIIGLTSWTGIARLTRAEFLRIRNLEYIQAARSLGYKEYTIMFKHALPNGMAPALVSIAFGIASAILVESSLSFLGIGVPSDVVTWGSLVNDGREKFSAWWLVIYPGLAIFITVTVYNLIGEGLRDALDPKQKR